MSEEKKFKSKLKEYMTAAQKISLGELPTYHVNCIEKLGVARPGKTAKERARRNAK